MRNYKKLRVTPLIIRLDNSMYCMFDVDETLFGDSILWFKIDVVRWVC
jgi:hypothetical protein